MKVARILLCAVSLVLCTVSPAAEMPPGKRADVEKLLEMTGALALAKQLGMGVVRQMSQMLKQARPDIPDRIIEALPKEVEAVLDENLASFKELQVLLYDKYFSDDELKAMIEFYSSDLGKKIVKVMPELSAESMRVGQRWGQSLGPQIEERMKAKLLREGINL